MNEKTPLQNFVNRCRYWLGVCSDLLGVLEKHSPNFPGGKKNPSPLPDSREGNEGDSEGVRESDAASTGTS